MTTSQPLVSVITPCYNAAPFIAETIESVQAQTYSAIEHIVVDDGSSDESWEIVAGYDSLAAAMRLEENRGGSYARNRGAERATGEFIMFLDADDLLAPETIAALVAAARHQAGCIAYCQWKRLRSDGARWVRTPAEVPLPAGTDHLKSWLSGSWVPTCSVLWYREAYQVTGGWDEELTWGDDGDLMLRALASGVRLVKAEGGQSYYRHHGLARMSVSSDSGSERKFRSQMRVLEKLETELVRQARLTTYSAAIGVLYYSLVSRALQQGHRDLAGECLRRGEALAGVRAVSRTAIGRLLVRLVGIEHKERIADALARLGVASPQRRQIHQFHGLRQLDQEPQNRGTV